MDSMNLPIYYMGGGAAAGYMFAGNFGFTPVMGAVAGAAAGYAAHMIMSDKKSSSSSSS